MTTAALTNDLSPRVRRPLIASWQWSVLIMQIVVLGVGAVIAQRVYQQDVSLLWHDPLGIRLAASGGVMFLLNAVLFLGGCALVAKFVSSDQRFLRSSIQIVLAAVCFFFLYLPVLFIVVNGPAAIS